MKTSCTEISPLMQELSAYMAGEKFAAKIKSEMTRMGKVIKDAGIRAE